MLVFYIYCPMFMASTIERTIFDFISSNQRPSLTQPLPHLNSSHVFVLFSLSFLTFRKLSRFVFSYKHILLKCVKCVLHTRFIQTLCVYKPGVTDSLSVSSTLWQGWTPQPVQRHKLHFRHWRRPAPIY